SAVPSAVAAAEGAAAAAPPFSAAMVSSVPDVSPLCFPALPPPSLCPARPSPVVPRSAARSAPVLAAEGAMSEPPAHHWS
ncbi:unnamed protein product, partial [Ectocarpus fasciculatus]